jgi:hypothetical protein
MSKMNWFLGVWLAGWACFCAAALYGYMNGDKAKMMGGDPIPLWLVLAVVSIWLAGAFMLLFSKFARKTFRLTNDTLRIETHFFSIHWCISLPRHSISQIKQVKDGGLGRDGGARPDSFPSWGLQIKSAAESKSVLQRFLLINSIGSSNRYRTILARLPYDRSEWLADTLGKWAGITPELCPMDTVVQRG